MQELPARWLKNHTTRRSGPLRFAAGRAGRGDDWDRVLCPNFWSGTVEPVVEELGWSELFVGVIIVPIIGNVAEHLVAVQMALKNRMELSVTIALGSSLQIALFVAPVLVFISLLFDNKLVLAFSVPEVIALAAASYVAALVAEDGESNWFEGLMLLGVYVIVALAFFLLPEAAATISH